MAILAPPVPFTPGVWSALAAKDQPVFYYRAPFDAWSAFCEECNDWTKREKARALTEQLESAREELTDDLGESPASRVRRVGLKNQIEALESQLASLPDPYTETEMLDAAARMFGHVLLRVDVGEESHTYPSDPSERVEFLKQFPFLAVAQLVYAIRNQSYRTESLGK